MASPHLGGVLVSIAGIVRKYLEKKHFREEKYSNRLQAVISEKYRQGLEATNHSIGKSRGGNKLMNA